MVDHRKVYDASDKKMYYVPCSPAERGAEEKSIFDIESEQLKPPVRA